MKNKVIYILFIIIIVLLCSCQSKQTSLKYNTEAEIDFVDDEGNNIIIDKPYERIISLYSAHTENLYKIGAGDKVIGGHTTCTYPPEAASKAIYDYLSDPEKVIAANPDLVLIRPFISNKAPEFVEAIANSGITVISLYPEKFEDFDEYINKLGLITGKETDAQEQLKLFHKKIDDISNLTSNIRDEEKKKVFFESTEKNLRTVTIDSMPSHAIKLAGGINIAANAEPTRTGSTIASFGEERLLQNAQNIDIYVCQRGEMNPVKDVEAICNRAGFSSIKAIKNKKVLIIDEKFISSPTFRYAEGVQQLVDFMYPDLK